METIKVEEQLFCLNSEFWNINMNKGMGRHPDSIMRNPYIQSTSEFSLKVFIFTQSTCRISGFKTSKVDFEEFLSALQPTCVIPSIAWRLIFHDATQAAACTRVLTLDVAVTLNSKAGSSTDSRAVVNRPHRGILGNLYRLCCSGIMVEIILWVLFWFFFFFEREVTSECKFHSSSLLVNIVGAVWAESHAPTRLIPNAFKIASQIDHKICVSIFSQATLRHMLLLISAHYHTNEDNFVFNILFEM